MDSIALNFHLLTCFVTVFLCINWQISLLMFLQLSCSVTLCLRITWKMYKYGREFKFDISEKGLSNDSNTSRREFIDQKHFDRSSITIDEAYKLNKSFKLQASEKLMEIRQSTWAIQYWLLIVSMILMYPTPLLQNYLNINPDASEKIQEATYWLFWCGIYVAPNNSSQLQSHGPIYILITVLIIDKIMQGWQNNRYGCTISKVRQFKFLDEKMRVIKELHGDSKLKEMIYNMELKEVEDKDFK